METPNGPPSENGGQRKDYFLPASILIAAVLISGSVLYAVGRGGAPRSGEGVPGGAGDQVAGTADVALSSRDVILGDPNAPVTLIEYGDYQCPFCGKFFSEVEGPLREEYIKTGKVKMAFRNFQFLGPESSAAAEAAECAKDQRQFWAYHDALYQKEVEDGQENNGNLEKTLFIKLARDLKLDVNAFTSCFDERKYTELVNQDREAAQAVGVNSTPTTFINGAMIRGALPYEQFKSAIETNLKGS